MLSVTDYWNADKLDIRMQSQIGMAISMMSSERKPPSMPPSQDVAQSIYQDFTGSTVSHSDNDLHLVPDTSARLQGRFPGIPEFEIWRTVSC